VVVRDDVREVRQHVQVGVRVGGRDRLFGLQDGRLDAPLHEGRRVRLSVDRHVLDVVRGEPALLEHEPGHDLPERADLLHPDRTPTQVGRGEDVLRRDRGDGQPVAVGADDDGVGAAGGGVDHRLDARRADVDVPGLDTLHDRHTRPEVVDLDRDPVVGQEALLLGDEDVGVGEARDTGGQPDPQDGWPARGRCGLRAHGPAARGHRRQRYEEDGEQPSRT
jgi:hypothetical protein